MTRRRRWPTCSTTWPSWRAFREITPRRRLHEEALSIRRAAGDPLAISTSLSNLGNVALDLDDLAAARRHQEEALALRREIGDLWAVANSSTTWPT
ncbi:MAG: tetratricopeptide repeat protein [Caldilineaceae bacterium]